MTMIRVYAIWLGNEVVLKAESRKDHSTIAHHAIYISRMDAMDMPTVNKFAIFAVYDVNHDMVSLCHSEGWSRNRSIEGPSRKL
jgi:hypothetical protein